MQEGHLTRAQNRARIWRELWTKARRNTGVGEMISGAPSLNQYIMGHGVRAAFKATIEEITFKKVDNRSVPKNRVVPKNIGRRITVVSARRFGKTAGTFDGDASLPLANIP